MTRWLCLAATALIIAGPAAADQYVDGYYRDDGTHVEGHYRTDPNGTVTDNYSFEGNLNPYTGERGSNRYEDSPSSPYYDGDDNDRLGY